MIKIIYFYYFNSLLREFTTLAIGILDKAYKEDDTLTSQLLTYDLVNWSHWTCLNLAVCANLKDFLSHAACQLLISDLWMGGMKIRKNVTFKVITALIFPPAIFAIEFKSAKELQYMPQTQEEHEQELEAQESSSIISSESENRIEDLIENYTKRQPSQAGFDDESKIDLLDKNDGLKSPKISPEQFIEMYDMTNNLNSPNGIQNEAILSKDNLKIDTQLSQERKTLNFFVRKKTNKLRIGKKIYEFYNAPITKFWQNTFLYIFFLMSFSYVVLQKMPKNPSILEIFVLIYIFSYGLDKAIEVCLFFLLILIQFKKLSYLIAFLNIFSSS